VLTISEVNAAAHRAASIALGRVGVSRVYSEPTTASDGNEVLSVTVVLQGAGEPKATGAEAVHAILRHRPRARGRRRGTPPDRLVRNRGGACGRVEWR
jgi:hypothetical protein